MDVSIVIPLYNEEESLQELSDWIQRVVDETNFPAKLSWLMMVARIIHGI